MDYWDRLAGGAYFAEPVEGWRRPINEIPPRRPTTGEDTAQVAGAKLAWAQTRLRLDKMNKRLGRVNCSGGTCAVPGCGAKLRSNNVKGVCVEHRHDPAHCQCPPCVGRREEIARRKAALAADPSLIAPKRRGRPPRKGLALPRAK